MATASNESEVEQQQKILSHDVEVIISEGSMVILL